MTDTVIGHEFAAPAEGAATVLHVIEHRRSNARLTRVFQHPYWVIDYSLAPHRTRVESGQWCRREPGTAHLYAPGTAYQEDDRGLAHEMHGFFVCFLHGQSLGLDRLLHPTLRYARFADPHRRLLPVFHQAAQLAQTAGLAAYARVQAAFFTLADILLAATPADLADFTIGPIAPDIAPPQPTFADRVVHELRRHVHRAVTLEELAATLCVSVSTLSHRFRAEAGTTPLHAHTQLRIGQAKHMLVLGEPLKTIAHRLGFADIYHLSKTFKRIEGLSPRQFLARTVPAASKNAAPNPPFRAQ
jgi:AraC-like DNA-binding protein